MTAFSELETRKPPGVVVVPPRAFADAWSERPSVEVAVGLRLIAYSDIQASRAQAAARANDAHPDVDLAEGDRFNAQLWIDAYHDHLMLWIVGRGMCDPNDAEIPWQPFKAAPEDMARDFLTTDGVKLIYDEWERMRVTSDPTRRELTQDDLHAFVQLLDKLPQASPVRGARIRRLLAFCAEELEQIVTPAPTAAKATVSGAS